MKQKAISKAKAAQLFTEKAVLFGSAAVDFAKRQNKADGLTFNGYGNGDYTAWYLTEYGFYIAATYHNVECIREGA